MSTCRRTDTPLRPRLDAHIDELVKEGWEPKCLVLTFCARWQLARELEEAGETLARSHPYAMVPERYRGLEIVVPGVGYEDDGAFTVGV